MSLASDHQKRRLRGLLRCLAKRWGLPTALLTALLFGHLLFGILRIPSGGVFKRLDAVSAYQAQDKIWHFRHTDKETHRLAAWLLDSVGAHQALIYDGSAQGALQLLGPLIYPSILVHHRALQKDGSASGRPVFSKQPPWLKDSASGYPVVIGNGHRLRWERR